MDIGRGQKRQQEQQQEEDIIIPLGTFVVKNVPGHGTRGGKVMRYNAKTKSHRIPYEDHDEEEDLTGIELRDVVVTNDGAPTVKKDDHHDYCDNHDKEKEEEEDDNGDCGDIDGMGKIEADDVHQKEKKETAIGQKRPRTRMDSITTTKIPPSLKKQTTNKRKGGNQGVAVVGSTVCKYFPRHGVFYWTVQQYFPGDKSYRVVYEDGDEEDLSENEVLHIVQKEEEENEDNTLVTKKGKSKEEIVWPEEASKGPKRPGGKQKIAPTKRRRSASPTMSSQTEPTTKDTLSTTAGAIKESHESRWQRRFDELKRYEQEHGTINISTDVYKANPALVGWIKTQCKECEKLQGGKGPSSLTTERVEALRSSSFNF